MSIASQCGVMPTFILCNTDKKDDWLSERGNNIEYYIPEVSGKGKESP